MAHDHGIKYEKSQRWRELSRAGSTTESHQCERAGRGALPLCQMPVPCWHPLPASSQRGDLFWMVYRRRYQLVTRTSKKETFSQPKIGRTEPRGERKARRADGGRNSGYP